MKYEYKGLLSDRMKSGNTRWRVHVEGQRNRKITIPMGPGEPGFDAYYRAARRGEEIEHVKPTKPTKGTFDALCENYLAWLKVQAVGGNYAMSTYEGRLRALNHARELRDIDQDRFGSLNVDLPTDAFIAIWDSYGVQTGAADNCFKALRAAYSWGADRGYPKHSDILTMKSKHKSKGGAVAWTDNDVEKYLSRHGPGTMARLWFTLADCTAGRIGDMPDMGPPHVTEVDGKPAITWQPKKKGSSKVTVLMTEMLLTELENHDVDRGTFLTTVFGKPFASSGSLDNRVREWIVQAKITGKNGKANRSQHGVRKGVAKLLAKLGATEYEIMTTLGHSDPQTTRIYTKEAERERMAISAAQKRMRKT